MNYRSIIEILQYRHCKSVAKFPLILVLCLQCSEKGYLDMLYMLLKTAENHARPVLLGTVSIADSEYFSRLLSYWYESLTSLPKP